MAQIKLYHYARCSSCREADALLAASSLEVDGRDIFKHRLSIEEIRELLRRTRKAVHELVSTRSFPYRELGLAARTVTADELIELMAEHPGLLKRPIVIARDEVLVGFDQQAVERLIASAGVA